MKGKLGVGSKDGYWEIFLFKQDHPTLEPITGRSA
jgi:hypothetical protein